MTKAEIAEKLKMIIKIRRMVDLKRLQIEELKSMREKITPMYSNMPSGGGASDRIANLTLKIMEKEKEIAVAVGRWLEETEKAEALIALVDSEDVKFVLTAHFIGGLSWEKVADKAGFTVRNVFYLYGRGLSIIRQKITK